MGATFVSPDGVVLVDKKYCLGCRYCVQACPYGCRYIHPEKKTVDKCTLCYHRITKGLTTACCENCPTGARQLVDLKNPKDPDSRIPEDTQRAGAEAADGDRSQGLLQRTWMGRCDEVDVMMIPGVEGFMYPNEVELQWSVLIVLYPFITGLVAGAFILASLERVFNVEAVKPTYRLALLTALAFLLVAPLPLQLHLGHPERSLEMYLTPHSTSAMAMFGFVYLWYLMVVLVLEIWLDYRARYRAACRKPRTGLQRLVYKVLTLGSTTSAPPRAASTTRSATSSPSSAFRRPSCCTAMSASSSARSRPTRGGRRR